MDPISFTSVLEPAYREDLERLLFFNPDQPRVRQAIRAAVEQHGIPRVEVEDRRLRVHLEGGGAVQALFAMAPAALRPALAGVAIYTRIEPGMILVLHLAVGHDYSFHGSHADTLLTLRFVAQLRGIAGRIRGVRAVRLFYGRGAARDIPVKAPGTMAPRG